jgi:hypothetical protein
MNWNSSWPASPRSNTCLRRCWPSRERWRACCRQGWLADSSQLRLYPRRLPEISQGFCPSCRSLSHRTQMCSLSGRRLRLPETSRAAHKRNLRHGTRGKKLSWAHGWIIPWAGSSERWPRSPSPTFPNSSQTMKFAHVKSSAPLSCLMRRDYNSSRKARSFHDWSNSRCLCLPDLLP